ncbi:MAG TPA: lysylphosphatidylglycerol synthase transmembrane domain-containing protein [Vicinamibacteria bacterium]|nr:lysylphosphatidylglycerol synthase transmembrane domain-containing protein [Vicinamibacteria bacterium]
MKRSALLVAKIAVSIALLGYLLSTTDLDALQRRVRAGDTFLLALAMALYAAILAISTWRWRVLLEAQGYTIPLAHLSGSYLVATFFNNFLPSNIGGDVVRVRDSSRLTGSTTTSLAVVAIDRILGLGALYVLALVAFLTGGPMVRELAGARSVLLALGLVFGGLAYVFFRPGIARRVVSASGLTRLPWALKRFETVQSAVHVYRAQMHAVWMAFLGSVALQAIVVYYYFTVARALRIPLPLSACFLMVPLCTLVQTVPISFNGWGIRESVFILYFRQVGLGRDSALAFSLVGAGLIVLMSLSGAIVWTAREAAPAPAPPPGA